jgi:Fe-S-cluster containining protein
MNYFKVSNTSEDNNGKTFSYDVCCTCKTTCCREAKPPLSSNRKKIIQEYLKNNNIEIAEPFTTERYTYPSVDNECICVFYDKKTKQCIIHSVKPETCIAGPITFGINMRKGIVEFFLKRSEICSYAGALFKDKPALMEHYKVARERIIELIKLLSAEELLAINAIKEPQTFMFCEAPLPSEVVQKLEL